MAKKKLKWPPEVIAAAKNASVAMAEFWDALRDFGQETGKEFDGTSEMIGEMAGAHDCPPSHSDLTDEDVIAHLNELEVS